MSNYKIASSLVALIALFTALPAARAQHDIQHIPPVINADGRSPDLAQPFIEPGTFEHDLQLFAPFELASFDDRPPAAIGFYLDYSRMYISITNPESSSGALASQPAGSKFIWGNRFVGGYMTEDDHGWEMTYMHIQGAVDDNGSTAIDRSVFSQFYSIDLNKTFRKEMHYGSYVEPYAGIRYIYFSDRGSDTSPDGLGATILFLQHMRNQIIGAQVGSRYFKQKGRWTISADVRILAGQNFQQSNVFEDDPTTGQNFSLSRTSDEIVVMGEVRIDAAYHITRDLSIQVGLELMHFGRGMNRADFAPFEVNPNSFANLGPTLVLRNDQDLTFAGAAFGVIWNR